MGLGLVGRVGATVAILLASSAVDPAAAQERSLAIQRGTFVFDTTTDMGTLDASATGGLRLNATMSLADGNFGAIDLCGNPDCGPGTVVDLSAGWGGLGVAGTARFRGTTYSMGGLSSDASLVLAFSGEAIMPPFTDGEVTVSAPFDFAGLFTTGLNGGEAQQALLTGGGTATLTLVPQGEGLGTWFITRVVFEFQPVGQRKQ
jgi:hypothetical protein